MTAAVLTGPLIFALLPLYLLGLFAVAWRADRRPTGAGADPRGRAVIYSLSIAVYCTSWTYFGAVGTAGRNGWDYLPIYLGPILAITLLFPIWRRVALATKRENIGSIADFLSSRYGKSRPLGMLVAAVAVVGALPYIALQLKSLSMGWATVTSQPAAPSFAVPLMVAGLAGFAILFGARRATLTTHSHGLVRAVAVESLVKLAALGAVAGLAVAVLWSASRAEGTRLDFGGLGALPTLDLNFIGTTFLALAAAFCLPRQFQMSFVELQEPGDLKTSRWLFPLYLVLTSLAVPPILAAGAMVLDGRGVDPDMYVLGLPLAHGGPVLTAFAFLGGFSAAAAMVTVETVALSAMVTNELLLPLLTRVSWRGRSGQDISQAIVRLRRMVMVAILVLASIYYQSIRGTEGLAEIGLTSFIAAAQLFPAVIGAVLWRRAHATGAIVGVAAGIGVWLVLVVAPQVWAAEPVAADSDLLLKGLLFSLTLNTALFVALSLRARPRLIDRIQASAFVSTSPSTTAPSDADALHGAVADLRALVGQFVGADDAQRAFDILGDEQGRRFRDSDPIDPALVRAAERMLAGAIGASSARSVIGWALAAQGDRAPSDVFRVLDKAAQAVQFNRELLQATLDNLSQGVSVVDSELRLEAWNARYLELLQLPADFVFVGKPIAEVIRLNALRSGLAPADAEAFVERRLEHMRRRSSHVYERMRDDGMVLKSIGTPMPNGGYVTSFTDVTELRTAAIALAEANEQLEERVRVRTLELTEAVSALAEANAALADAKAVAERASRAQSRFLAAASHDLLQPLHAARLFLGALEERPESGPEGVELVRDADRAIDSADGLLRSLLNLSRLEVGGIEPEVGPVSANSLLQELWREFAPVASDKGLQLRMASTGYWVVSDRDLLRSVLQNLVGNAVRYTASGAIVVGCRKEGDMVRFEVRDTGPGIPPELQVHVFEDFYRLPGASGDERGGVGLGLAIADRVCRLLGHPLGLRSAPGSGSTFTVTAPRTAGQQVPISRTAPAGTPLRLRVLCIENEPAVLKSMTTLLVRWGADVTAVATYAEAVAAQGPWDVVLADHHLDGVETGLDAIRVLLDRSGACALITANASDEVVSHAAKLGVRTLRKPIAPASLRAFLASITPVGAAAE